MNAPFPASEDQIKAIATHIAAALANGEHSSDIETLRRSIEDISVRLDKLERSADAKMEAAPAIIHPSQDRFQIAEAIVDRLFENSSETKACTFEPHRACDHCSMCSSRGF